MSKESNRKRRSLLGIEELALADGEALSHEGPANLQRGLETAGGWLFVTDQRLIFHAHKINLQKQPLTIARDSIESATPCWTKLLGILPVAPNSIEVKTVDGHAHRFVVQGRSAWLAVLAR